MRTSVLYFIGLSMFAYGVSLYAGTGSGLICGSAGVLLFAFIKAFFGYMDGSAE